jgi:BMFP domain-containing protein YqiC
MAKTAKKQKGLMDDYQLLERVSKQLSDHRKKIASVQGKIARKKIRTDLEDGLIENLDIVSEHMANAQKEVDRARKRLKLI